jgi:hypothetical protein
MPTPVRPQVPPNMSNEPQETSTTGEGTWTETVHHAISSTSGGIHRAVDAVAGSPRGTSSKSRDDNTQPTATTKQGSSSQPSDPEPGETRPPTLTEKPTHSSTNCGDPTPSERPKSKDNGLPPAESKECESSTSPGDAPKRRDKTASSEREVNKGSDVGSTDDSNSRPTASQDSGPMSMSGTKTSHPGAEGTPAAAGGAPAGDPASGQPQDSTQKQGNSNPLNEPSPKSKEDAADEGTGQKYVKSTGVAAKGGDFDAAKPGAGVTFTRPRLRS